MEINIKRIDSTLPLPEYKTVGAVAFDLSARETITVPPRAIRLIPLNVIIRVPDQHFLLLASRSSLPLKKGLTAANGIGVIDRDYCGPEDEIKFAALNITDQPVTVDRGERIAQAIILPFAAATITEVTDINAATRGGFGSTGSV